MPTVKAIHRFFSQKHLEITVLVCWEHTLIVDIVRILGGDNVSSWVLILKVTTRICDLFSSGLKLTIYRQFEVEMKSNLGEQKYINANIAI